MRHSDSPFVVKLRRGQLPMLSASRTFRILAPVTRSGVAVVDRNEGALDVERDGNFSLSRVAIYRRLMEAASCRWPAHVSCSAADAICTQGKRAMSSHASSRSKEH